MKKERVIVGLSGGVDSSVAAYLLKEQGYEVIGMFMKNWHDDSVIIDNECPWVEDSNDAMIVAQQLDIPYYVVDYSEEYKERIVDYMINEYKNGRTPNPDVLCNREIKFDLFYNQAMKLGAKYVATGHYARVMNGQLHKAIDSSKDQSYFLSQVPSRIFKRVLFPLGDYTKDQIREIAKANDLITATKKDSQGLCFVGKIKLPDFLSQQLKPKSGICIDANTNEIVGQHKGAHFFTIGQRKGHGAISDSEPYYVCDIDIKNNILYVCKGKTNPMLYSNTIEFHDKTLNVLSNSFFDKIERTIDFQIRYHGEIYSGNLASDGGNYYFLEGNNIHAATKGQFVVMYDGDLLLGSSVISNAYK